MADLNLDAFKEKAKTVSIDGKDYELAPYVFENIDKYVEHRDAAKAAAAKGELGGVVEASKQIARLVVPGIPDDVLGRLSPGQRDQLSSFWLTGAVEEAQAQDADAKEIVKDPTPPG